MWALVESSAVTKVFTKPQAFNLGDNQYPINIFELWSSSALEAIGVYEIVIDNTNLKNREYYINTNQTFAFADSTVTATYGTPTAKELADVLFSAQDETDGYGTEGELKTRGLKYNHKVVINQLSATVLQETDWLVLRETEGGTACPSATKTWRAAVRTKANAMTTAIDAAANVDALAALYIYNDATPPVRPLGEFPTL